MHSLYGVREGLPEGCIIKPTKGAVVAPFYISFFFRMQLGCIFRVLFSQNHKEEGYAMKKQLFVFLVLVLLFSACRKEEAKAENVFTMPQGYEVHDTGEIIHEGEHVGSFLRTELDPAILTDPERNPINAGPDSDAVFSYLGTFAPEGTNYEYTVGRVPGNDSVLSIQLRIIPTTAGENREYHCFLVNYDAAVYDLHLDCAALRQGEEETILALTKIQPIN